MYAGEEMFLLHPHLQAKKIHLFLPPPLLSPPPLPPFFFSCLHEYVMRVGGGQERDGKGEEENNIDCEIKTG